MIRDILLSPPKFKVSNSAKLLEAFIPLGPYYPHLDDLSGPRVRALLSLHFSC
jgi:hypothetical protein